ncbi:MAG: hypothetical protein ACOCRO_03155 [Halanaerobiales bacterium]
MGYHRDKKEKKRLRKLYEKVKYSNSDAAYYDANKDRIVRNYQPKGIKNIAKEANKQVRRYDGPISDGREYKKISMDAE